MSALEPGTACLLSYRGAGNHVMRVPCVVVTAGSERVKVETVARGRITRRWVEYKQLEPDPARAHPLWEAYGAEVRAVRAREAGRGVENAALGAPVVWAHRTKYDTKPRPIPAVVARVGPKKVQVEVVEDGRVVRRWADPGDLTPDPERTHSAWSAYEDATDAARRREEERS